MVDNWTRIDNTWRKGSSLVATVGEMWATNGIPLNGQIVMGMAGDQYTGNVNSISTFNAQQLQIQDGDPNQRGFGLWHTYYRADAAGSQAISAIEGDCRDCHDIHVIPWINVKMSGSGPGTWADVTAGNQDSWILPLLADLGALAGPVWISWHHEPDGDSEGTKAEFRAMQQYLYPLVNAYDNLAQLVTVGGYQQATGGSHTWDDYYPGDDYCDGYIFNPYMKYLANQPESYWEQDDGLGSNVSREFAKLDDWATAGGHDIMLGVGEYGISAGASATAQGYIDPTFGEVMIPGPGSEWLQRGFAGAKARGGRWGLLCYWPNFQTNDWRFTESAITRADMRACLDQSDLPPASLFT